MECPIIATFRPVKIRSLEHSQDKKTIMSDLSGIKGAIGTRCRIPFFLFLFRDEVLQSRQSCGQRFSRNLYSVSKEPGPIAHLSIITCVPKRHNPTFGGKLAITKSQLHNTFSSSLPRLFQDSRTAPRN